MASPTITGVSGAVVTGTSFTEDYRVNLQKEYLFDSAESDFTQTDITYDTGLYKNAWSFNGTSSKASAPSNNIWSNQSLFSSFWLKIPASDFGNRFIFSNNLLGNGWYLFINTNGTLQMLLQDRSNLANFSLINTDDSMVTGWNYVEFWYRDNNPDISYGVCINRGTDKTQTVGFRFGGVNMGTLNFGTFNGTGQFLLAEVDRLRFYSNGESIGFVEIPNATQRNQIYNAPAFYIDDTFNSATRDSDTQATLTATPTTGDTVYVYNREGSDSFTIPEADVKEKITLTRLTTSIEISPPLYGYESLIKQDWTIVNKSNSTKGIYDSGADYDVYQCKCSFLLNDADANSLLELVSSTARGEEIVLNCSSGFFPFTPFRGDGEFTVRLSEVKQGARRIEGMWPVSLTMTNVGVFPAYTPVAGYVQGRFKIGAITGLPYPRSGYQPDIKFNLIEQANAGDYFFNTATNDSFEAKIDLVLSEGNCADVVEKLLTDRTANVTIGGGDNHYIFGRIKGDGDHTAYRMNPDISVINQSHNQFRMVLEYKWVS